MDNTMKNIIGCVLLLVVIGSYTLAITLSLNGCDEEDKQDQLDSFAVALAPEALDAVLDFIQSPQGSQALGADGARFAELAAPILLPRLLNRSTSVAAGEDIWLQAYTRLQSVSPGAAAVWYRVDPATGLALGAWPRIEAELRDLGYLGTLSLRQRLNDPTPLKIADADRAVLEQKFAYILAEEMRAVYGEDGEPPDDTEWQR
jgi:hypothetical protein